LKKQFHFGIISAMSGPESLPLSELSRPLLAALRALPGMRAEAWLVLEEDEYETKFGDGRFLYACAAFLHEAAARARLDHLKGLDAARRKDPGTLGTLYHLKRVELLRDEARNELRGDLRKEAAERYGLADVVRLLATP
jgi:hypothetical protein